MELNEYISKKIKERRVELNISRYKLMCDTGITYQQLINIEKGQSTSTRLLSKIFDVLQLEIQLKNSNNENSKTKKADN